MLHVAAIRTPSYGAWCEVLRRSLLEQHPEATLHVLDLGTGSDGACAGGTHRLTPDDLGLPAGEVAQIGLASKAGRLATALKPALLSRLLAEVDGPLVYVDVDAVVHGPLDGLVADCARSPVVLTRHFSRPATARIERDVMVTGSLNAGVLAVAPGAEPFLRWWHARCCTGIWYDPYRGLHGDQRWLDRATTAFGATIHADPGMNVMDFALVGASLQSDGDGWTVDGSPLKIFHAGGGFDVGHPRGGRVAARRETRPSGSPAFAALLRDTRTRLLAAQESAGDGATFGATLPSGLEIDKTMRRVQSEALVAAERGDGPEPPNPFVDEAAWRRWLSEPVDRRRDAVRVPRYLYEVRHDVPGLLERFPLLLDGEAEPLAAWARETRPHVPSELVSLGPSPPPAAPPGPFELLPGITAVADPLDERVTAFLDAVRSSQIDTAILAWSPDPTKRLHCAAAVSSVAVHDVNLICVEAEHLREFDFDVGVLMRPWRRAIARWTQPPGAATGPALTLIDEIWVPDDELAGLYAEWTVKPVRVVPEPKVAPDAAASVSPARGRLVARVNQAAEALDAAEGRPVLLLAIPPDPEWEVEGAHAVADGSDQDVVVAEAASLGEAAALWAAAERRFPAKDRDALAASATPAATAEAVASRLAELIEAADLPVGPRGEHRRPSSP